MFLGATLGSPETTGRSLRATAEALAIHVKALRARQPAALGELVIALRSMLRDGGRPDGPRDPDAVGT